MMIKREKGNGKLNGSFLMQKKVGNSGVNCGETIEQGGSFTEGLKERERRCKTTPLNDHWSHGKSTVHAEAGAGVLWTKRKMDLDRRSRKMMAMHNAFQPNSNVDRICLSKGRSGRSLISYENCIFREQCWIIHEERGWRMVDGSSGRCEKLCGTRGIKKKNSRRRERIER